MPDLSPFFATSSLSRDNIKTPYCRALLVKLITRVKVTCHDSRSSNHPSSGVSQLPDLALGLWARCMALRKGRFAKQRDLEDLRDEGNKYMHVIKTCLKIGLTLTSVADLRNIVGCKFPGSGNSTGANFVYWPCGLTSNARH